LKINLKSVSGFTLIEVMISVLILAMYIGSMITGYIVVSHRAEWSIQSSTAHNFSRNRLEQFRGGRWSTLSLPPMDELIPSNFPPIDMGLNMTNYLTIITISINPPVKMVKSDTVWSSSGKLFTNSLTTYVSP